MAKTSGLGDACYVGGYDLSGDVGNLNRIGGGPALLDVTAINSSAMERIGGLRDGAIEFVAFHNTVASREHVALAPLPTADTIVTYARGTTLGNPGACCTAKQVNYDPSRAADGMFTFAVSAQSNGTGIEWGEQLTAGLKTDTTATNGTAIDFGSVSTLFGWQAYLQVTAFTGTSVTVTLQDSADNAAFANLTGGAFAAKSAIGTERLASAAGATVRRYVRAITSGTFSSATFSVVFVRNLTTVVF
jgi:hypothetical protein